jgi:hypothetical protein
MESEFNDWERIKGYRNEKNQVMIRCNYCDKLATKGNMLAHLKTKTHHLNVQIHELNKIIDTDSGLNTL